MRKNKAGAIAIKSLALLVVLGTALQARSQEATTPYPNMAPIEQYLMTDRDAEIALARSAAPESIARDAEVQVLARHGFETAVKGKNGFVCIVESEGAGAHVCECGSRTFLPSAHHQDHRAGFGGTHASSG